MGDHFMLLMDPLLTESTIEAASESRNLYQQATPSANRSVFYPQDAKGFWFPPSKLVECRICHDGGEDSNMEIPCSCCGSLKYAHRKCVQRWCNDKGDTICEICFEFMVLLVLCHTLPIVISGVGDYSLTWTAGAEEIIRLCFVLWLLMLRTIGILLPINLMVKVFTGIQCQRHQQDSRIFLAASNEENELPRQPHSGLHFIHVR